MQAYTLEHVQDEIIGKQGTRNREVFELELQMDLIGSAIKQSRKERKMTQSELGNLIGVQKSQISRIENNPKNVTLETLVRVFTALQATIKLQIELPKIQMNQN
jgi:DNA-binding XRE family transcriptional regulator